MDELNEIVQIKVSPDFKARLQTAADYEQTTISEFVRRAALQAIREVESRYNSTRNTVASQG